MGRVRAFIVIDGGKRWTLFDSGAENTCVTRAVADRLGPRALPRAWRTRLGGRVHVVKAKCDLVAHVQGRLIEVEAYVLDRIGGDRKAKRDFDVLFGALAMQKWGIELDLRRERVDVSRYSREFVEF